MNKESPENPKLKTRFLKQSTSLKKNMLRRKTAKINSCKITSTTDENTFTLEISKPNKL